MRAHGCIHGSTGHLALKRQQHAGVYGGPLQPAGIYSDENVSRPTLQVPRSVDLSAARDSNQLAGCCTFSVWLLRGWKSASSDHPVNETLEEVHHTRHDEEDGWMTF